MPIFLTSRKLLNRAVWSQRHTWYQIKSPGVWPASDLLFTDQTKISVRVLFQGNDLRDWSLYIFGREGEGGGSWERVIDFLENWVLMNCQWGGGRGGVMKRFQNFSGDQVNFMVKIMARAILLPLKNLLVLINTKVHSISCCYLYWYYSYYTY